MKNLIPTKSEVKKYFKGVKKVKSFGIYKKDFYKINKLTIEFDEESQAYYCDTDDNYSDCLLWCEKYGYAKIIN